MTDEAKPLDLVGRVWASGGVITTPTTGEVEDGWEVGDKPPAQFFNYIQNRTDKYLSYLNQKGVPEWDMNTQYIANKSIVAQSGNLYLAKQTHTNVDPSTDVTFVYWGLIVSSSGSIPTSQTAYLLARANHTGTQAQSTVTNLVIDLAAKEVSTNKVTNFSSPNNTTYPTTLAVQTLVAGGSVSGYLKTETAANVLTSSTTLLVNRAYDVDTTAGAFNLTLPAAPAIGSYVWLYDVSATWDVNKPTLLRNGQLIEKLAQDQDLDVRGWGGFFVFIGGSYGWVAK